MRLDGKVALVTGAASGIGHAIAKRYVEAGGRVAIADLNIDAAGKAARELGDDKTRSRGRHGRRQRGAGERGRREDRRRVRPRRHSRLQRRHPDRASDRGLSLRRLEEDHGHPRRRRVPDDEGVRQAHVQAGLGLADLHGLRAQPRGIAAEVGVRGGEARILGLGRTMAKEGAKYGVRSNVICPGFVRTPLVEKQIPEQAQELGITEERVVKEVLLGETVDKQFTMVEDIAESPSCLAAFKTNALTGESIIVSHGWHMN